MKIDYRIEGLKLVIEALQEAKYDGDKDGEASVQAEIGAKIQLDAAELMQELLKAGDLVKIAQEQLIKLGVIKG